MKALVLQKPGHASIETVPDPVLTDGNLLLKVRMVGFCGSDLNSFRGLNPLISFPRILGHEVCATVVEGRVSRQGRTLHFRHTPAAASVHPADEDARMHVNSTRRLEFKGTALSRNLS
jgi:hypothetical protein